jgi:hypothetical protein
LGLSRCIEEGPCVIQLRVPAENSAVHGDVGGYDLVSGTWAYPGYIARRSLWPTEK